MQIIKDEFEVFISPYISIDEHMTIHDVDHLSEVPFCFFVIHWMDTTFMWLHSSSGIISCTGTQTCLLHLHIFSVCFPDVGRILVCLLPLLPPRLTLRILTPILPQTASLSVFESLLLFHVSPAPRKVPPPAGALGVQPVLTDDWLESFGQV